MKRVLKDRGMWLMTLLAALGIDVFMYVAMALRDGQVIPSREDRLALGYTFIGLLAFVWLFMVPLLSLKGTRAGQTMERIGEPILWWVFNAVILAVLFLLIRHC